MGLHNLIVTSPDLRLSVIITRHSPSVPHRATLRSELGSLIPAPFDLPQIPLPSSRASSL